MGYIGIHTDVSKLTAEATAYVPDCCQRFGWQNKFLPFLKQFNANIIYIIKT
jgi:hypothetical protein